jgi:hypothetical protein
MALKQNKPVFWALGKAVGLKKEFFSSSGLGAKKEGRKKIGEKGQKKNNLFWFFFGRPQKKLGAKNCVPTNKLPHRRALETGKG